MDFAAFPTISYHPLIAGSDELFAVRWYKAADGALPLNLDSLVSLERLWDSDAFQLQEWSRKRPGCEPRGLNRDFCPLQPYPGTEEPLGLPDWYRRGVPAELVPPLVECCCDFANQRRSDPF